MNKKVLGIGEVVLDKVHKLASFPLDGEKMEATDVTITLGGPVPVALILLARLGVECVLSASVAQDEGGEHIKSLLANEGVLLLPHKTPNTPVHTVLVNAATGSRTIIKDSIKRNSVKAVAHNLLKSVDLILCDRHEPLAVIDALAHKRAATISLMDPSVDCSERTLMLLGKMDVPIIPIETLHLLFPRLSLAQSAQKLSAQLNKSVVVTMGEYGSGVWDNNSFTIHPSIPVKVVDTLGAGDIYRGGFAYGLLSGWNIHECAQFANTVAALQCTKRGNSTAIPTKSEIIAIQKLPVHLSNSISLI